jgi:hypothetical protein
MRRPKLEGSFPVWKRRSSERSKAAASLGLGFEVADSPRNFPHSGLVEAADQPLTQ